MAAASMSYSGEEGELDVRQLYVGVGGAVFHEEEDVALLKSHPIVQLVQPYREDRASHPCLLVVVVGDAQSCHLESVEAPWLLHPPDD